MRFPFLLGAAMALTPLATPAIAASQTATPTADVLVTPAPKAGRSHALIVIVADSAGAQTTDFIIPYSILKEAGVADVRSLSTRAGNIRMTRGLTIVADETIATFDAREPAGADIVIVPAQAKPDSAVLIKWLRAQAAKGATIVSVCEGARVLAQAGLLDGRQAVTHWASLDGMIKSHPNIRWLRDRRYVQDGTVITTAGVTASIPASLALVEALGGHDVAQATAQRFGVTQWSAAHRTADYTIGKSDIEAARLARSERSTHDTTEVPIADGVDEMAIALETEAWGRTYRTEVVTTHPERAAIRSHRGLVIVPDAEAKPGNHVLPPVTLPAVTHFEATLGEIGQRYGTSSIRLVTMPMEYDPSQAKD